jgi:hypothetical protein
MTVLPKSILRFFRPEFFNPDTRGITEWTMAEVEKNQGEQRKIVSIVDFLPGTLYPKWIRKRQIVRLRLEARRSAKAAYIPAGSADARNFRPQRREIRRMSFSIRSGIFSARRRALRRAISPGAGRRLPYKAAAFDPRARIK